ncbi:hypothetical protein NXS98_16650 [Fontisphaera persica]|uniref:hypothetical protein n=1 Tax=Fontisphaera persica TaxID=2974023 RepID=UPI0024BF323D|nr:hypothetical protein [Fontisphaera persica]WCJ59328.1 hypothetical protein NXS98_16650 [Fontisphaera persica]
MNTRLKLAVVVVLLLLAASALTTWYFLQQRLSSTSPPAVARVPAPAPALASEPAPPPIPPMPDAQPPRRGKPPPVDPLAREALQRVGADPEATAYWIQAINDPRLPRGERKDLIEDLNEDGFTDKKRPTLEDLPLVEARIELIELLAPHAMDEVNADAFQEAYKDLLQIRSRLTGQPLGPIPRLVPR